jgi:hypothetical protein
MNATTKPHKMVARAKPDEKKSLFHVAMNLNSTLTDLGM